MQRRKLGQSELTVSQLCLGGNVFGWTADERTSFDVLDAFVDGGGNFIDTADVYSRWIPGHEGGESERVIGNWLKRTGKRTNVVIATKVGWELGPDKKGLGSSYVRRAVEDSLRRLQTDYIDLYQAHRDDPNTPLSETLETFADLIRQGKVRVIGASNYSGERLAEGLEISTGKSWPRFESLQPEYNLYQRAAFESDLQPLCAEHHIGVIPYFSLAGGFLTGKYRSEADLEGRARGKTVGKYLNERGFRILDALDSVARQYTANPAKVSLAWLMAQPTVTAPIASATAKAQLKDLLDAANLRLDAHSLEVLNEASAENTAAAAS